MVRIQVDASVPGAERLFDRFAKQADDLRPALRDIGETAIDTVQTYFDREGSHEGPWAPLSEAYLRQKTSQGFRRQILQKRGILRRTINYRVDASALYVGSPMVYAAIHNFGGRAGRGRRVLMPARPFLNFTSDRRFVADLTDVLEDHLSESWENS